MFSTEFASRLNPHSNYRVNTQSKILADRTIQFIEIHYFSLEEFHLFVELTFTGQKFVLHKKNDLLANDREMFCPVGSITTTYIIIITRYNMNVSTRKTGFPVSNSVANRKQGK